MSSFSSEERCGVTTYKPSVQYVAARQAIDESFKGCHLQGKHWDIGTHGLRPGVQLVLEIEAVINSGFCMLLKSLYSGIASVGLGFGAGEQIFNRTLKAKSSYSSYYLMFLLP